MPASIAEQVRQLGQHGGLQLGEVLQEVKKAFIEGRLAANRGNQSLTARELGEHRNTLRRHLDELEINPHKFRKRIASDPQH